MEIPLKISSLFTQTGSVTIANAKRAVVKSKLFVIPAKRDCATRVLGHTRLSHRESTFRPLPPIFPVVYV